jgi:cysteine-rich repeat protein
MSRFTRAWLGLLLIASGGAAVADSDALYWTEPSTYQGHVPVILRGDLRGQSAEPVVVAASPLAGIAFGGGKLYFYKDGAIRRSEPDGSNEETLVAGYAGDIALDVPGGRIYWSNSQQILRANIDGSDVELVYDPPGPYQMGFLELDLGENKLYFVLNGAIFRSDLDDWSEEFLYGNSDGIGGLALDLAARKMYFANGEYGVYQADLDGSHPDQVYFTWTPFDVVLDPKNRHLYVSDWLLDDGLWLHDLNSDQTQMLFSDFEARNAHIALAIVCGNGTVDEGEECDDGNYVAGDGCEANCTSPEAVPALRPVGLLGAALTLLGASTLVLRRPASPTGS